MAITSSDDMSSQVRGRAIKAKLLAVKSDYTAAEQLAREAATTAESTDDLYMQGEVFLALAEVLRLAGRDEEAIPVLEQAAEVSQRKGNVVTARNARAQLADLQAALDV
jgi:tetratricopeptide (TPR) repeat protein